MTLTRCHELAEQQTRFHFLSVILKIKSRHLKIRSASIRGKKKSYNNKEAQEGACKVQVAERKTGKKKKEQQQQSLHIQHNVRMPPPTSPTSHQLLTHSTSMQQGSTRMPAQRPTACW